MSKTPELWTLSEAAAVKRVLQFAWRSVVGGRNRPKVTDAHRALQKHLSVSGDLKSVAIAAVNAGLVSRNNIGALQGAMQASNKPSDLIDPLKPHDTKAKKRVSRSSNNSFYTSWEWTTLRMKVIKTYGRRCMCCGATPSDGAVIQVDHIKPRSLRPDLALDFDNMQVLCQACNRGKGNWCSKVYRPGAFDRERPAWQAAVDELDGISVSGILMQ